MASKDAALRGKRQLSDAWIKRPGVQSVMVTKENGDYVIEIDVTDESLIDQIPDHVGRVPVVIDVVDPEGFAGQAPTEDAVYTDRHRPVPPGVSIGGERTTACTTGFPMQDPATGILYGTTNNHCGTTFAQQEYEIGEEFYQPSDLDGGDVNGDVIGHLAGVVHLHGNQRNFTDLSWYRPSVELTTDVYRVNRPYVGPYYEPDVGDPVHLIGRTTGHTQAEVTSISKDVGISDTDFVFYDQIGVDGGIEGGDSGGPCVAFMNDGTIRPVGLVFATFTVTPAAHMEGESGLELVYDIERPDGYESATCVRELV